MNSKKIVAVLDAPEISLTETEQAGDALLKFYIALGWNENDYLDPCKIRTTKAVYHRLYDLMLAKYLDALSVGALMVNKGPGVDDDVPTDKVQLLDGWITPAPGGAE